MMAVAEAPKVPRTIEFAGLTLKLNEKARNKIQAEVNALTKHPKYFQIKVDRLQIYFPIIERIFREEELPEDFKYLSLQESALISDAVSSSKAVGYWQFKREAGTEVGLRIDREVDERKNIVSSTRGAARYLKKNNRLYFDNWVHALLAYHQGPGGAMKLVGNKYRGARTMPINGQTHWYVIKFLAHKIAFEPVKPAPPKLFLEEYYDGQQKTIKQIAQSSRLDYELVREYNKWLKRGKVPADKTYAVILPYDQPQNMIASTASTPMVKRHAPAAANSGYAVSRREFRTQQQEYPLVYGTKGNSNRSQRAKINGISGVIVGGNDNLDDISKLTGVTQKRLLYYNDVSRKRPLKQGEVLYLKPKKGKAKAHYHIVEPGEDLWSISQRYGIKLSKLRDKNRIAKSQQIKSGRVLWLRFIRPADEPVAYQQAAVKEKPVKKEPKTTKVGVSSPGTLPKSPRTSPVSAPADTVKRPIAEAKPKSPAPETLENDSDSNPVKEHVLTEEKEFELDEPVNFVGVDKSKIVANSQKKVHVVQTGETLYSIAQTYNTTVSELQEINALSNSTDLKIGQELIIDQVEKVQENQSEDIQSIDNQFIVYQVKPGETLYQIARDHQATIKEVMEWNNKKDFNISVGEELKLLKRP